MKDNWHHTKSGSWLSRWLSEELVVASEWIFDSDTSDIADVWVGLKAFNFIGALAIGVSGVSLTVNSSTTPFVIFQSISVAFFASRPVTRMLSSVRGIVND